MEELFYVVAESVEEARNGNGVVFDSDDVANSYAQDNPGMELFTVKAIIDFSTVQPL